MVGLKPDVRMVPAASDNVRTLSQSSKIVLPLRQMVSAQFSPTISFEELSTLTCIELGLIALAMCFVDPRMPELHPNWYAYLSKEIIHSLGFQKSNGNSVNKFSEVWSALVEMMQMSYLHKKSQMGEGGSRLAIEAVASTAVFEDSRAKWDVEKGEFIQERELLKEELQKAQAEAASAQSERDRLKAELKEWENSN
ncbi:hypothetical protein R1flu_014043 [Riccia fluitans]|uniref:Uncharacterized protein n=1 Tax=Riccia fluitans TaxID=41844 RepID=A0ABD1YF36_9MARC